MTTVPTWLQLACSLQPPRPSWHRSATVGRERVTGPGDGRGMGLPPHVPSHLLTCTRAAIPFVAQAAFAAVACTAHCLGCTGWDTHRLQLCPQGPPHRSRLVAALLDAPAPPTHPQRLHLSVQLGHALVWAQAQGHSPSCTSQSGPVQPSSQKQEPEPPRPSSQCP